MSVKSLSGIVGQHPFFEGLPREDIEIVSGCAKNVLFKSGKFIAQEGEPADDFYLLRTGVVTVEVHVPHRGSVVIQTLKEGQVLGWSWLFPPYRWTFDCKAREEVRAISLDGKCLREKCEKDPGLGYRLMKLFSKTMTDRLRATRLQLLDVYSHEAT